MMYQARRPAYPPQHAGKRAHRKMLVLVCVGIVLVVLLFVFFEGHHRRAASSPSATQKNTPAQTAATKPASFNKTQYSLADPASLWTVVNKHRPLAPKTYTPADLVVPNVPLRVPGNETMQLRKETAGALEKLFAGAETEGLHLMLSSGYRSYAYQVNLYGGYVKTMGQAAADQSSARPGYSEHQTGLAADVEPTSRTCEVEQCFGDTPEGKWVAANAYKYGFIVRYTQAKVSVTGYEAEPWHVRYVGTALATEMHNQNVATLEEFFGLGAAPGYSP